MPETRGARSILTALAVAGAMGCGGSTPSISSEATIVAKPLTRREARSVAAATTTAAHPTPFVTFPSRSEAGDHPIAGACGTFVVRRDEREVGRVSVTNAREASIFEARPSDGDRFDVSWCGDLDGDGRPELALFRMTGGAHCCRTDIVLTLDDHPVERLRAEAGNAGGLRAEDLDQAGAFELVSADDSLTEIGDLPYAFTPFLPVVFALDPGKDSRFARRTARFPRYLEAERQSALQDLGACNGDATCQLGLAEKIAGISVILGDWPRESTRLALPPDILRTTSAAATRLAKILRARGEPLP